MIRAIAYTILVWFCAWHLSACAVLSVARAEDEAPLWFQSPDRFCQEPRWNFICIPEPYPA